MRESGHFEQKVSKHAANKSFVWLKGHFQPKLPFYVLKRF